MSKNTRICAISGGQDSIFLLILFLHLQKENSEKLTIVSCNHFLQTQNFRGIWHVWKLAFILKFSYYVVFSNKSLQTEQISKIWRYSCFNRIIKLENAREIAVGHTLQDKIETGLWFFLRGTSPLGVTNFTNKTKFSTTQSSNYFPQFNKSVRKSPSLTKNKIYKYNFIFSEVFYLPSLFYCKNFIYPVHFSNNPFTFFLISDTKYFNQYVFIADFFVQNITWRPLKNFSRQVITKIISERSLPILPDLTNSNLHWSRNRTRNYLLPILRYFFQSNVDKKILQFFNLIQEESQILEFQVNIWLQFISRKLLSAKNFKNLPLGLQREILFSLLTIYNPFINNFLLINTIILKINKI